MVNGQSVAAMGFGMMQGSLFLGLGALFFVNSRDLGLAITGGVGLLTTLGMTLVIIGSMRWYKEKYAK